MQYPLLLQFAIDHPWVSFWLSWPFVMGLVIVCWSIAGIINNAVNTTALIWNQLIGAVTVLVRGYPKGVTPPGGATRGDNDEGGGENKPFAG